MRVPFAVAIALLSMVRPVPAQTNPGWKLVQEVECTAKDKSMIRCLLSGEKYPTGTLTIKNTTATELTFSWHEWHSECNKPGGQVVDTTITISGYETKVLPLLSPGHLITCREVFLLYCHKGGPPRNCPELLSVTGQMYTGNYQ